MSKLIVIDAGHWISDSGAKIEGFQENTITIQIRDELKKVLPDALYVPDNLDLKMTIEWINERVNSNSLAISIHVNSQNDNSFRGTEAYYYNDSRLADIFSKHVAEKLGVPNRGAKPDTQTYVGELGFLRKLKCQSVLIECLYLTNLFDRAALIADGPRKIAEGIKEAIKVVLPHPEVLATDEVPKDLVSQFLSLLKLFQTWLKLIQKK